MFRLPHGAPLSYLRITGAPAEKIGKLMKGMQQNIRRMDAEEREDMRRDASGMM